MKRHEVIGYYNQYSLVHRAIARPTMSFRILLPCFKFFSNTANYRQIHDTQTAIRLHIRSFSKCLLMIFNGLFVVHHVSDYLPLYQNGGTEVQIGMEGTAACYSRLQYQAIKVYSAGAHLQRTGETIAPSALSCFMAASTSLRSSFPSFRERCSKCCVSLLKTGRSR